MDGTSAVDFNSIFDITQAENERFKPVYRGNVAKLPKGDKNPSERHIKPLNSTQEARTRLQREADRRKAEQEKYRKGISKHQEAIRKSGTLRNEIMHGILQGEDTTALLLKACECISLQTGEDVFYIQAKESIRSIYGYAFGNPYPLQLELGETKDRLEKLLQAEQKADSPDRKRRLQGAIREHRKKIQQIEESLRK